VPGTIDGWLAMQRDSGRKRKMVVEKEMEMII
jgi:hypothetical protein